MPMLRSNSLLLSVFHRSLDAGLIALALWGTARARELEWDSSLTLAAAVAIGLFLLLAEARRLYGSWRLRSSEDEYANVLAVWVFVCAVLLVAAFLLKVSAIYSRAAIVAWFLVTPALLMYSRLAVRALLRALRRSGRNIRAVAVVGTGSMAESIVRRLEETGDFGVRLAGVYDDRGPERTAAVWPGPLKVAGNYDALIEQARTGGIDYVFIALPTRAEKRIVELVNRLADTTATVYVIPDLFISDLMRAQWTTLGGLPAVSVFDSPFDGVNGWLKRAEDVVLGSAILAVAALPMLAIALGVVLTTRGSVLFRQKRYGLSGRVVEVLKFRTMTASDDGPQVAQAQRDDPRVTRFGRFLRAFSLDELPQLFNVLAGSMSLVGPRPHAVAHNEEYRRLIHGYMLRHKVKPGITGWAQVNGWRGETDTLDKMQKRVAHDLEYVQNWSLWLDLRILAMTVAVVASRRNAY
ncbi:MAG TPA: undecaprenyl-phosphate glucose phosphotransferase [Burkholderiales bacterium]|nr:undecaprenyl-phosphate glucose phosphotransferase [Burkholderiales bacterium]